MTASSSDSRRLSPSGAAHSAPPVRNTSLHGVLRRTYSRLAIVAMSTAVIPLVLVAWIALRAYADDNLHLVARSLAYTVEAAVVFGDTAAAHDAISLIATQEDVAEVRLTDIRGRPFAQWQARSGASMSPVSSLSSLTDFVSRPVVVPIIHNDTIIGHLDVRGSGRKLAWFMLGGIAGVLGCVGVTIVVGNLMARRMYGDIVAPLRELADVAYAVRRERSFGRRVQPTPIVELHQLGDDFNALLGEFEGWQNSLREQNKELSHQANHDAMTGLPNRAHFEAQLNLAMALARETGSRLALLYIDSNRFKDINDKLGHEAGDAVLVAIAARLQGPLRRSDVVARIGGDEFVVMLPGITDETAARNVARALVDAMHEPILLPDGSTLVTTISVGLALYPDHGHDAASLLRHADAAMYRAKRSGDGVWGATDADSSADAFDWRV